MSNTLVFLPLFLLACVSAQQCGVERDIIKANGVGERSLTTTIAVVRLGIETEGKTAKIASDKLASASNKLVTFLNASNVDKLQTTSVQLFPQFNFDVSPRQLTGYRASISVSFEVEVGRSGTILDDAVKNGATNIDGVSFKATPDKTVAARKQALADAVNDAKNEALAVGLAANRRLGRASVITIMDSFSPGPIAAQAEEADITRASVARRVAPSTQIVAREQVIRARVAITYTLY